VYAFDIALEESAKDLNDNFKKTYTNKPDDILDSIYRTTIYGDNSARSYEDEFNFESFISVLKNKVDKKYDAFIDYINDIYNKYYSIKLYSYGNPIFEAYTSSVSSSDVINIYKDNFIAPGETEFLYLMMNTINNA